MKYRFTDRAFCARVLSATLFLTIAGAKLQGQITFNNFQSTTGLTLNGNAARSGNVLRLTPSAIGQVGSAWFNNAQPVGQGFTTSFTFQFSQPSVPPADGIAFVIQNQDLHALGGGGGSIGYGAIGPCSDGPNTCAGGIVNSVAVEFDTFDNGSATGDPPQNHIAVQSGGLNTTNCPAHTDENDDGFPNCTQGTVSSINTNMSNGQPHTVVIDYNPNSNCGGDSCSLLTVSLDGTNVLSTQISLGAEMTLNDGNAFVGFTSATGEEFENHDILNWTFTPHTTLTVGPLATPPGQTTVFNFGAFNFKSTPANTTSNGNSLTVTAVPVSSDSALTFGAGGQANCIVYDNTGGTCWEFDVICTGPDCGGTYDSEFQTSYDHTGAIAAPGFLKHHSATSSCPRTDFDTNQIDQFFQTRIDPTTKAKSGGTGSCWVATQNTTGVGNSIVNFIGFASPVSNTALNLIHPPQAVPLVFQVLDSSGNPITNLTLCTTTSCPAGTVNIQQFMSTCSVDDNTDINPSTDAPFSGGSGLQNLGNGNYQFNWKTQKGMTGCWTVSASFGDGVPHIAVFKVK